MSIFSGIISLLIKMVVLRLVQGSLTIDLYHRLLVTSFYKIAIGYRRVGYFIKNLHDTLCTEY